jgi:hypothetical protein
MDRIPGNFLDPSDGRFTHAFDAQSRDFIKSGAPVLESIIGPRGRGAECLPTSSALVATTLSPPSPVETVADNASCSEFSRPRASPVWTAETLHRSWTLWRVVLMVSIESQTIPRRRVTAGSPTVDGGSTAFEKRLGLSNRPSAMVSLRRGRI